MPKKISLDQLWRSTRPHERRFEPDALATLPDAARRYLEHAIAPGTPLASAVRLKMHGEIKLRRWLPFTAEEVIDWKHGMIWKANVRMNGLPIVGSDRFVENEGSMRWKLLGLIPVMKASGPEITRSTLGRVAAESVWLPSALCNENVEWHQIDESHVRVRFAYHGEKIEYTFAIDENGRLQSISLPRWGDPEGKGFRYETFGGIVEDEETFGGYTIPTRLRLGWFYGSDRFESEGEFFRGVVDDVEYR